MQLLTEELRKQLPPLYSQEAEDNPAVHIKYFTPDSNWTWWATEGEPDGDDFRFFGFAQGQFEEWGYFLLSELEQSTGPLGLHIERDLHFVPGPFTDVVTPRDS